ncbi:MAG: tRNA (adenosine(37)-N6)-threonylcarbamoyltransferase complex dimerization subunit type 1 TsaB [Clostridia bacterium]|nr:tRNA (adenosine(37)-N6)-threonylcarbamoyltransferase complex dimerization subunit type 1 TsaB [Clostridia bacterium]
MNTLIIDCSSGMSVYVLKGEEIYSKIDKNQKKHTDELLYVVDELLTQASLKINQIENLCVCIGPGSFTGIRVAISIIKGLAVESNAKVFVLTNFDIFQNDSQEKSVYVLDGFSKFVYARTVDGENTFDECIDVGLLVDKLKMDNYKIYVENEKVQNLLKNSEIISNIAQNDIILHFLNKIKNNDSINLNMIEPIYLRASQAEIERNKRLSGENNG